MYIACEEMNFMWTNKQVEEMTVMWDEGLSIYDIAEELKRKPEEVMLLIIDRNMKRKLKARKRGIFGN